LWSGWHPNGPVVHSRSPRLGIQRHREAFFGSGPKFSSQSRNGCALQFGQAASSEQTDVVASIGNTAVRPIAPALTTPSTAHGEPTAIDVEADVVRRARALVAERRRLGMG